MNTIESIKIQNSRQNQNELEQIAKQFERQNSSIYSNTLKRLQFELSNQQQQQRAIVEVCSNKFLKSLKQTIETWRHNFIPITLYKWTWQKGVFRNSDLTLDFDYDFGYSWLDSLDSDGYVKLISQFDRQARQLKLSNNYVIEKIKINTPDEIPDCLLNRLFETVDCYQINLFEEYLFFKMMPSVELAKEMLMLGWHQLKDDRTIFVSDVPLMLDRQKFDLYHAIVERKDKWLAFLKPSLERAKSYDNEQSYYISLDSNSSMQQLDLAAGAVIATKYGYRYKQPVTEILTKWDDIKC